MWFIRHKSHATIADMLRVRAAENPNENPLSNLPYAVIYYSNTNNKSHGFTLYELVFGHTLSRLPETQKNHISKYV